jgi:hypothetical protein
MKKRIIKTSAPRLASLVGIMLWSAHYHGGQWSREYRMGCRARTRLERSNEIGAFLASRWFDALEHYASGQCDNPPAVYVGEFSAIVRSTYRRLAALSEAEMSRRAAV